MFLGAIQSINPEVYEAAEIDGANRWDQFRYIIIPSIRNIVFLNIILGVSGSLSVFDIPYIMTGGSNETSTFVIQTIDTAFKYNKVGLASAMAIILLFIVIVVSLIQKVVTSERKNVWWKRKITFGKILQYLILLIGATVAILPILVVFIGSFKSNTEFLSTGVLNYQNH